MTEAKTSEYETHDLRWLRATACKDKFSKCKVFMNVWSVMADSFVLVDTGIRRFDIMFGFAPPLERRPSICVQCGL